MLVSFKAIFVSVIFVTPILTNNANKLHDPVNDKNILMDLKNFQFSMNHIECGEKKPFLLILISSAPANVEKRQAIRETWGQRNPINYVYFLVGMSKKHKADLEMENLHHNDLIQGNFVDTYKNLTYKHVMALKWVKDHCSSKTFFNLSDFCKLCEKN